MTNDLAIRILNGDILGTTEQTHEAVAMAVKALSALPPSDAVEVVRCKDCYHYIAERRLCFVNVSEFEPTDFCSYGEKNND